MAFKSTNFPHAVTKLREDSGASSPSFLPCPHSPVLLLMQVFHRPISRGPQEDAGRSLPHLFKLLVTLIRPWRVQVSVLIYIKNIFSQLNISINHISNSYFRGWACFDICVSHRDLPLHKKWYSRIKIIIPLAKPKSRLKGGFPLSTQLHMNLIYWPCFPLVRHYPVFLVRPPPPGRRHDLPYTASLPFFLSHHMI